MPFLTAFNRASRSARQGRSLASRALAGLWMLLYLGIVAAAPVADGFVDHDEQVVVHIEDADGGDCPASHGPESCDICQLAHGQRAVLSPVSIEMLSVADAGRAASAARDVAPVSLTFLDGRSSRAPPLG